MSSKKWIVKRPNGIVLGPFSTEEILHKIRTAEISGQEMVALFPEGRWQPVSRELEFYDQLLKVLTDEHNYDAAEDGAPLEEVDGSDFDDKTPIEQIAKPPTDFEATQIFTGTPNDKPPAGPPPSSARTVFGSQKGKGPSRPPKDIELIDIKKLMRLEILRRAGRPVGFGLAILIVVIIGSLFWNQEDNRGASLVPPQAARPIEMDPDDIQAKLQRMDVLFKRDVFSSYNKLQTELTDFLSAQPHDLYVMQRLCMTYFELWPYVNQSSSDFKAINKMVQMTVREGPSSDAAVVCKSVDLFVKGRGAEAASLIENQLQMQSSRGITPVDLFYLKAYLLNLNKEYEPALIYLQGAQKIDSQRLKLFVFEAEVYIKAGRLSQAASVLRKVLAVAPKNAVARGLLGLVEFRQFRHFNQAEILLKEALDSKNEVSRAMLSEFSLGLAEIYLVKNDQSSALRYAQQAYSDNSSNVTAKNLILRLGGVDKLKKTVLKGQQLVFEGDQFVREGDCNAAQAHYKAAFELEKQPVAAYKAAQCLWKLSFSTEALDWLQKAIKADPKFIEAYVLTADYYTRRYNFLAAARILGAAQRMSPKSYEVYRGFSMVELRRNSPQTALTYGKKALSIYEWDVDTLVLMAEAYILLKDFRLAMNTATKAVAMDSNNREAQVAFARALTGVQGANEGARYLIDLIRTYPMINDYRLALGRLYAQDERFKEAKETFEQITRLQEKPKEALIELGKVLSRLDKRPEALKSFLKAAVLDPADAEPLFQAGLVYLESNRPADAVTQFLRVLQINPRYPLVQYYIGRSALLRGDTKAALAAAQEERKANPNLAEAYLLAAEVYTRMEQYQLCTQEYQQAIKLRPQGADIYVQLARCYRLSGNLDVAISMLNHAVTQESGNPGIYREQGEVYERKGDLERAVEAYSHYFVLNPGAPDRELIEARIGALQRR